MNKYEWLPTESALEMFPMRIIQGTFILEDNTSIYIPPDKIINRGLGEIGSIHLSDDNRNTLPKEITLTWFSYSENKFYKIESKLPLKQFSDFFDSGYEGVLSSEKKIYDRIIIGIWPEGGVSFYVSAECIAKEVFFGIGSETDFKWHSFFDNKEIPRNTYIENVLKDVLPKKSEVSNESLKTMLPLYECYRKFYNCGFSVITNSILKSIRITFFNGVHEFYKYKTNDDKFFIPALPKEIRVNWVSNFGINYTSFIDFNEVELTSAFMRFESISKDNSFRLQPEINEADKSVRLFLVNEENFNELKTCRIKTYRV